MEASMNRRAFLLAPLAMLESCTVRAHLFVSGVVQGVSFRASTQDQARRRGIVGWVKNLDDGRVEAVAQGSKDRMRELVAWCRKGPPAAKVEKLDVTWEEVGDEFRDFEVRS
jgi:acylphosphatase